MPNEWWRQRTPEQVRRLEGVCRRWIEGVFGRAAFPLGLRRRVQADAEAYVGSAVLTYQGDSWCEATLGLGADDLPQPFVSLGYDRDLYRVSSFASAIEAWTSFQLARLAPTAALRGAAVELLVRALTFPLQQSAWERLASAGVPPSRWEEALDAIIFGHERLRRALAERCPAWSDFAEALRYARTAAANAASDYFEAHRRSLLACSLACQRDGTRGRAEGSGDFASSTPRPSSLAAEKESSGRPDVPELLEALYPLGWRAAAAVGTGEGLCVLPLLLLGGVSHRRANAPSPWKQVPRLVQAPLIDAHKEHLGDQFIRDRYAARVSRLMCQHGMLEVIREVYLGLVRPVPHATCGEDGEVLRFRTLDDLWCAAGSLGVRVKTGRADIDTVVGWDLFLQLGRETATRILAQELAAPRDPLRRPDPAIPRGLIAWVEAGDIPSREEIAWLAERLCARYADKAGWLGFLRALNNGGDHDRRQ